MTHLLPLYTFFDYLQKHRDFELGIAEYKALIEVLVQNEDNRYFNDPEEMYRLCELLWLKPNQNRRLFRKLYEHSFANLKDALTEEQRQEQASADNKQQNAASDQDKKELEENTDDAQGTENSTQENQLPNPENSIEETPSSTDKDTLYLNFEEGEGEPTSGGEENYKRAFSFVRNYVPLNARKLAQHWKFFQRPMPTYAQQSAQIDIPQTIATIAQQGGIVAPVYLPQVTNTAQLTTLIDHKGSMIAFRHWSLSLVNAAKKMAQVDNQTYFFQNVPQKYLAGEHQGNYYVYQNQAGTYPVNLAQALQQSPNTAILIVSDAGAASGRFDPQRIEATEQFLEMLYRHSLKIAWLNPMPEDRWNKSSAYIIRELVDMFPANEQGLKKAIQILQGKAKPTSAILYA